MTRGRHRHTSRSCSRGAAHGAAGRVHRPARVARDSAVHCRINLDHRDIGREGQNYKALPVYYDFGGKKQEVLRENFFKITRQVEQIVLRFNPAPQGESVQSKGTMNIPPNKS